MLLLQMLSHKCLFSSLTGKAFPLKIRRIYGTVHTSQHCYGLFILLQYRYQVLSEGKRSRVKGSDLALMEPCSDSQNIAVGSRIVGENFL